MSLATIEAALSAAFSLNEINEPAILAPANKGSGAGFQCNGVMKHAGLNKLDSRKLAADVIASISLPETIATFSVGGPGFINVFLQGPVLCEIASEMAASDHLSVVQAAVPEHVVIDFGGPNVAKALHVGHLRSFVVGESIRRLLTAVGHTVISDIHLGDFGLQMGKLLLGLEITEGSISLDNANSWTISTLEGFYLAGQSATSKKVEGDAKTLTPEAFARLERARNLTTALQNKEPLYHSVWQAMRSISMVMINEFIAQLDARFDLLLGESDSYQDVLSMIETQTASGTMTESDGALVIDLTSVDPKMATPLLIKSKDGSLLYGATDLAALKSRIDDLGATMLVYCTDMRQNHHIDSVFKAAAVCGYARGKTLKHAAFGTVKDTSGKPLQTRDGVPYKLADLLSEMRFVASSQMGENADADDIEAVAMGALKFADLSPDRLSGYVFDPAKMMALEGKSGPYLQYACARINAVLSRAGGTPGKIEGLYLEEEKDLLLEIVKWPVAVARAADDLKPHFVAEAAFALAQAFSRFYAAVPIVSGEQALLPARLGLCELTSRVLTQSLFLLGIPVPKRM